MRRPAGPAMVPAAAAAVLLLVGTVVLAGELAGPQDGSTVAAGPPTQTASDQHGPPTDADYRAMAAAASERTLAKTPVPDGAVRLEQEPPGWPELGMALGPSDPRLTRTAWWSVPMSSQELARFLASHEPKGLHHFPGEDVIQCGNDFGLCSTTYDPTRQTRPEAFGEPSLLVQFAVAGGRTLMRADTFTFARPVRPPESYITRPVTRVGVDRVVRASEGLRNVREPHVEITDPGLVDRLVEAVNALYGHHGLSGASCGAYPGDPRPSLSLQFDTASGIVRVQGERACWEGLTITREGRRVGPELDPGGIDQVVERVLSKSHPLRDARN